MKTKQIVLALTLVFGASVLAPTLASAAPRHHKSYKVCKMDRHHHRVCHWVRR